jgi:hypothetical protein
MHIRFQPILLFLVAVIFSCSPPASAPAGDTYASVSAADTCSGSGDEVFYVDTTGRTDLTYDLNVGSALKDVYFIFTNTGASAQKKPMLSGDHFSPEVFNRAIALKAPPEQIPTNKIVSAEPPEVRDYNRKFRGRRGAERSIEGMLRQNAEPAPLDQIGDTAVFSTLEVTGLTVSATCRAVVDRSSDSAPVVLSVWVADDCWTDGGTKQLLVDQEQTDALAAKFLAAAGEDDIFHWLTNILGREWGPSSYDNLIGANNEITILIYDIAGDDGGIVSNGGYLGAFYSRDNYTKDTESQSNQRIMFYLDPVFGHADSGTWHITDTWPSLLVSTLAHEFQHMIHFYQKTVRLAGEGEDEVWLNEMCSLLAEDLVADKLGGAGPRGVPGTDGTAGSANNQDGRLPLYNYYNDASLIEWLPYPYCLVNYSTAYAFGAYLARNYGGAALLRGLVLNPYTDYRAVEAAAASLRGKVSFATILREWGAANLLSDRTAPTSAYAEYNAGDWFASSYNGVSYHLGSINLFSYTYTPQNQTGPFFYTNPAVIGGYPELSTNSNTYFYAGRFAGSATYRIKLDSDVRLTVVVKE